MPAPLVGIVFCDLDDTFLSSGKHLLPRNMAALDLLAECGIAFVPCTGRGLNAIEVYPELAGHPAVRYAITSSGAVVYGMSSRTVIHSRTVGHERALALYGLVRDLDVSFDVFADGRTFAERWRYDRFPSFGLEPPMLAHIMASRTPLDRTVPEILDSVGIVERVSVFNRMDEEGFEQGRLARAAVAQVGGLRWTTAHPACIEVVDAGCSKGEALTWLCDHLGIDIAASVAFGDSDNDIEMLEAAGCAVAMGNARAVAKEAADMIAPANDEAGVAVVLEDLLGVR
jgi:Cof subfamily protein (haloacid dehalogenase superfamily)